MSSSDDDDYMSDAFLAKFDDKRPGLLNQQATRQHKQEIKHQQLNAINRTKPRKVLEAECRNEGLGKAISSENKGFSLLQKMGYKPGMAIGKKGEGRSEPVPVVLKSDRGGLGQESERKRKMEEQAKMRQMMAEKRRRAEANYREDFRSRKAEQSMQKGFEKDLYMSQKVCHQLDTEKGMDEPSEQFFWPANALKKNEDSYDGVDDDVDYDNEEDEEEDLLTAEEKLEVLTAYLRNTYIYCAWCGIRYQDSEDLSENCPGSTSEAHN